jgi:hypothetical protein
MWLAKRRKSAQLCNQRELLIAQVNYCLLEQQYQFADRYVLTHHCYWLHEDHIICDWRCYYSYCCCSISFQNIDSRLICFVKIIMTFLWFQVYWLIWISDTYLFIGSAPQGKTTEPNCTKLTPSSFGPMHLRNVHHVLCRVHLVPDFDECSPCVCYSELWVWFLRNVMEHFCIVTVAGLNLW